ncbi:MAG: hypothetical protein GF317_23830 [Candidatus Lokiarchaeota archaeon]|nr:hypothetical protein [Candidatus Lokiarchaeota archaeon]MBD3202403.1 hypothetical protein [Candidatus Lokiarchaeota archaeon]
MSDQPNQIPSSFLYLGILIISGIAGILVLVTDFGGVYNNYGGYYVWEFIGILNFPYNLIIIAIAGFFFYNLVISLMALKDSDNPVPSNLFTIGFFLNIAALSLVILGAIALGIVGGLEADDWWFDAGFYGGIIGGIINLILYFLLISNREVSISF